MQATLDEASARALEAVEVGADGVGGEPRVGAEGAGQTGPARLGGQVDLRVQRGPQTDRHVLGARDLGELADRVDVVQRSQPDLPRPA